MNNFSRLNLAESIVTEWNANKIPYAVVHGLANYPNSIGRDIDLVMQACDVKEAACIAINIARQQGYTEHYIRWSSWGLYQLALINRGNGDSLPLDFMCEVGLWQAKFSNFMTGNRLKEILAGDEDVGPFRVSRQGEFIKACLRPLVCGDLSRFGRNNEFELPINFPTTISSRELEVMIGEYGVFLLNKKNVKDLEIEFPYAIKKIQMGWVKRNPIRAVNNVAKAILKHFLIWLNNSSIVIHVKTKNSIALKNEVELVRGELKSLFVDLRCYFFSDSNIKALGFFSDWRFKPVSEFNVSLVFEESSLGAERLEILNGKGCNRAAPDYELRLPDVEDREKIAAIKNTVLDILSYKYSYDRCFK